MPSDGKTPERGQYRYSGKVNAARFVAALAAALAVSAAVAWCMAWNLERGFHLFPFFPHVLFAPAAAAAFLTMRVGHCRNFVVAAATGMLIGMACHLGGYEARYVSQCGFKAVHRLDLRPGFLKQCIENDKMSTVSKRRIVEQVKGPVGKWVLFSVELAMYCGFGLTASLYGVSSRCYCETCHRWMRRRRVLAAPGSGKALAEALAAGNLERIAPIPASQQHPRKAQAVFDLYHCPGAIRGECPADVYLSVAERVPRKGLHGGLATETLLLKAPVRAAELPLLAEKIPGIEPPLLNCIVRAAEAAPGTVARPFAGLAMESLPRGRAAALHAQAMRPVLVALYYMPYPVTLLGAGMVLAAISGWVFNPAQPDRWVPWVTVAGPLTLLIGATFVWGFPDFFGTRWICRAAASEVRARPRVAVHPEDPEAMFVSIVPRESWGGAMPIRAADSGWLKVDLQRRWILLEGAAARYVIAADAVLQCRVDPVNPAAGPAIVYAVSIRLGGPAASPAGTPVSAVWELPVLPRVTGLTLSTQRRRRQLAEALCQRILAAMTGAAPAVQSPPA